MKRQALPMILAAAMVAVALTGCTLAPDGAGDGSGTVAVASYPTQFLVEAIAGDDVSVVVLGRPGVSLHDYEPTLQDLQRLRGADILVLHGLGMEPWVEQAVQSLGANAPHVVRVGGVPADEGLLKADHVHLHGGGHGHHDDDHGHGHHDDDHGHGHHDDDHGHGHHDDDHGHGHHDDDHGHHAQVSGLEVIHRATGDVVADVHGDHWHGHLPEIQVGSHVSLGAVFLDEDGHEIHLGHDEEHQFMARLAHGAAQDVVEIAGHGDHLHLRGLHAGSVEVVFQLLHDGHADWESPPVLARVVEEDDHGHHDDDHGHGHGHHDDHSGDGHDHHGDDHQGDMPEDPHTWLDPLSYAAQARNVAAALGEAYPEHAAGFSERADAVVERLHGLHRAFEEGLAECALHTIATNHNAYAYMARRYHFQVESLHDIEPGFQPSPSVVDRVLRAIQEQGLPVMFLEEGTSPDVVRAIERETGVDLMVLNTLEVAPASGDYFTAMEENLERLRYALDCR